MSESTCQILYHERRSAHNPDLRNHHLDGPTDLVFVQARRWNGEAANDVVVEVRVIVDGETIVDERERRDGLGVSDHEVQREAIDRFDRLLAISSWAE